MSYQGFRCLSLCTFIEEMKELQSVYFKVALLSEMFAWMFNFAIMQLIEEDHASTVN